MQRTFIDALVLAGFMDENHFGAFSQEYFATLSPDERGRQLATAAVCRTAIQQLPLVALDDVVLRPLADPYVDAIAANEPFVMAFRQRPYQFAWINPHHVVALQVFVTPRRDPVPNDPGDLMRFALPDQWDVPAEISFIPPLGPIQVMTSSPHLAGLQARLEADVGRIVLEPPRHINLVQVVHYNGRYYLRNGYHRMFDAIRTNVPELPALVVEALQPADLELNLGNASFNAGYTIGLARPPLVADFATQATLESRVRLRRYGVSVALQITPLNVGI